VLRHRGVADRHRRRRGAPRRARHRVARRARAVLGAPGRAPRQGRHRRAGEGRSRCAFTTAVAPGSRCSTTTATRASGREVRRRQICSACRGGVTVGAKGPPGAGAGRQRDQEQDETAVADAVAAPAASAKG
jgi:hypothetical protein